MSRLLIFGTLITVFWIPVKSSQNTAVVQTTYGPVKGEEVTFEGTQYKAFKGIPYAAPPVGNLRFAAPKPPSKWTEVRDATSYGYLCPQFKDLGLPQMSEDCLTLNVFTKSLEEKSSKPVLVWIHGGGFCSGDSTDILYGPQYLIGEDIVIVTFNYRLGPLGFLSTNTADFSGNWGLKDQVAALKWVQENIVHFGGNPKQVTIYGESAGGISAHLHLFSPLSKGLFSKAIISSGAATVTTSIKSAEQSANASKNLARVLKAPDGDNEDPVKRIEFLRRADAEALIDQSVEAADDEELQSLLFEPLPFLPVIEAPGTKGAFITEDPRKLLQEGKFSKVPLIIGLNDLEGGIMFLGLGKEITPERMKEAEKNVCQILPGCLKKAVMTKNGCLKVAKEISKTYFGGKSFDSSLLNFVNLCGDLLFTIPVHLAQVMHARVSNQESVLYNYYFTFDGEWNLAKDFFNISLPGAVHSDELAYVFRPALLLSNATETSPEVMTKNRMVRLVSDFVKHGNPTPAVSDLIPVKWEPAKDKEHTTMVIGKELKLEKEFLKTRMDMWDKLYKEYKGHPLFS